jgi:phosphinothricin acetyltransferase
VPPTIRLATEEDAEQVLAIYAPFCRDSPVSFETREPTLDEVRQRIRKTLASFPWLVCDQHGQVLGYAYASPHREREAYRWSVDVSVYVRDGLRRQGIGRALYTSLFAILRLQGFFNALAGTTLPNPGSEGLHQAMGFQPVGSYQKIGYKCGAWHDVAWWQLALREPGSAPEPPLLFPMVSQSPECRSAIVAGNALLEAVSARAAPASE